MLTEITTLTKEEPNKEGGKKERTIIMLKVTLSKDQLDTDLGGYQAPLPESEVVPFEENFEKAKRSESFVPKSRGLRGGFRGRRQ